MYFHALYTGTTPKVTSIGSQVAAIARMLPTAAKGEAEFPLAGTIPAPSAIGVQAQTNIASIGLVVLGNGQSFPSGPYHTGEEVL